MEGLERRKRTKDLIAYGCIEPGDGDLPVQIVERRLNAVKVAIWRARKVGYRLNGSESDRWMALAGMGSKKSEDKEPCGRKCPPRAGTGLAMGAERRLGHPAPGAAHG
jgi:hypothetical protein